MISSPYTKNRIHLIRAFWLTIRGFKVDTDKVGSISIEIYQPYGNHFDLHWSKAGQVGIPIPDNEQLWTLNIGTDGFAEWSGELEELKLRISGYGKDPVIIRSIKFMTP